MVIFPARRGTGRRAKTCGRKKASKRIGRARTSVLSLKLLENYFSVCSDRFMKKRQGRKPRPICLTPDQRDELEKLARRTREKRGPAFRARVILMLAKGTTGIQIVKRLRTSNQTVCALRYRFLRGSVEALFDERRPGTPRKISDDKMEAIVVKTLEERPKGATHWSTRMMANKMGLSQSTISRIWR